MDEELFFGNETCVDAVHPRIAAISKDKDRRSRSGKGRQGIPRGRGEHGVLIEVGSVSSSSNSISTNATDDFVSTCSSCESSAGGDHSSVEVCNNVEARKRLNPNGTVSITYLFPPKSHLKSYLPKVTVKHESENHDLKEDYLRPRISSCCKQ